MTVPPDEGRDPSAPGNGSAEPPLDFDPYRFGRPDHPVAPEYAPPGYQSPAPPTAQWPPHPYNASPPPPPSGNYGPPANYGPPGNYGYQPPRTGNTKAVLALVFGVLAILFCWLSLLDLVLIVPAIVLGALARADSRRNPERGGRGMATSGLICAILALVLAIVSTVYIYQRIKPCVDKYGATSQAYQTCATDRIIGDR